MVQAYILIQTEVGRASDAARQMSTIRGVIRVDAVTGPYDVIALTQAQSVEELGTMVLSSIQRCAGITRTLTCSVVHI